MDGYDNDLEIKESGTLLPKGLIKNSK